MKALFIIGQCVRLLGADPWEEYTFKIYEVGQNSYLGECAYQTYNGWKFEKCGRVTKDTQKSYGVVPCPKINWEK